jgi:hypothetical protein
MAYDCEFIFCQGALAKGHLLDHLQNESAILFAGFAQHTAKLVQIPGIFA